MNRTCFLPVLASGMALLLFPVQAAQSAPEKDRVRSAQQEESSAIQVDIEGDELDIDMDIDVPDVDVEIDEPQVDMDIERDEPEMDADFDQEDVDREEMDHDEARFAEHEQEKIQKSFAMPAGVGRRTLEIDNVWGSIEVVGAASDQVQLTVNKSILAESKGRIEQARKDVTLDITQQADGLQLYVNGPFRCDCHDCGGSRDDDGYIVKMDFQVQVPRDIAIKVKTVNEGGVSARDIKVRLLGRNINAGN